MNVNRTRGCTFSEQLVNKSYWLFSFCFYRQLSQQSKIYRLHKDSNLITFKYEQVCWMPNLSFSGLQTTHPHRRRLCLPKECFLHHLPPGLQSTSWKIILWADMLCTTQPPPFSGVNYPIMLIGVPLEAQTVG